VSGTREVLEQDLDEELDEVVDQLYWFHGNPTDWVVLGGSTTDRYSYCFYVRGELVATVRVR
jgi:hypothetical protein